MKLVTNNISINMLKEMSKKMYGGLVKAVIDIQKEIMVVDAEMHADEEEFLLENGSEQDSLWGINMHPAKVGQEDWIEFDSMINIRPNQNNGSRYVHNPKIREKIISIVNKLVEK